MPESMQMANRFRGFLPVVVDVETGGFNETTDALLQIAAVLIDIDERGDLYCSETVSCHVNPFPGANLEPKSMEVNGIDVHHPRLRRHEGTRMNQSREAKLFPELFYKRFPELEV